MFVQITEPTDVSSEKELKGKAIGIDLGTTHTVVGYVDNGQPLTIPFEDKCLLPSIITYLSSGKTIIGDTVDIISLESALQFSSFKRQMHQPSVKLKDIKTPVELSALILRHVKERTEEFLSQPIDKAVITVPAYFDDTARQATKDAALIAGLQVLRLINEPTAAALAYGLDQSIEGIYAIYDLGGGTFDISLLKMTKGVFQVLATGGDIRLGGDDVDHAIVDYWLEKYPNLKSISPKLARQAKEALFQKDIWEKEGFSLNKAELRFLVKPIIQKTLQICQLALKDANLSIHEIQGVVLVGGSTRLQEVRLAVKDFFHKEPLLNLDPDQIVALGAALQADALTQGSNSLLLDVAPLSLGLETIGGIVEKIVPRNMPIPATVTQEFTTYQDGQTSMKIHIVQGERELAQDCRSLAEFNLNNIPPLPAGSARVEVSFNLDSDGLLTVQAKEKTTGMIQNTVVKPSYGLSATDLEEILQESFLNGKQDIQKRLLIESQIKAKQIIEYLQRALNDDKNLLINNEKFEFEKIISQLQLSINESSAAAIQECMKKITALMQPFLERRMATVLREQLNKKH